MEESSFQQNPYENIVDINTRLRILENKYVLVRERMFVINQNMIDGYKKLMSEIKAVDSDLKEIKGDLFSIKESMRHLVKEMDSFARKENLKVLEKYINMWNPLKFVTEEEVLELIKKKKVKNAHRKRKKSSRR